MSWINANLLSGIVSSILFIPGSVQAVEWGVDGHAGTMGAGVGATVGLTDHLNIRFGVNAFDQDIDIDDDEGLNYDGNFDLSNQYLVVDLYPTTLFNFHLTAGIFLNDNEISALATVVDDNDAKIGATDALAGTQVIGGVTFDDTAGYVGLGWGNTVSDGFVHFGFDLGVVLQGSPIVSLDVRNQPTGGPITAADIEAERLELEDEASDFDSYPLIQFNLGFSF